MFPADLHKHAAAIEAREAWRNFWRGWAAKRGDSDASVQAAADAFLEAFPDHAPHI